MEMFDVIVAGAGPAGLLAAGRAAESGGKVLVLEKMRHAGRKLLITGNGRCNITNNKGIGEFMQHVFPNGRFLRNALSGFFSEHIIELLQKYGVEPVLEYGWRYFPASSKSADVLRALLKWADEKKVEIRYGYRVEELLIEDNSICGVRANGEIFGTKRVILATGGKSYPVTGSTGDGYELARREGHTVENVRPALVPLKTGGGLAQKLQGLNLKNVKAVVWVNDKKAGEAFGEMIFTHFGLSGPAILALSRIATDELPKNHKVEVTVDLRPELDEQELDAILLRDLNEHGKKKVGNIFRNWLPASMIPVFIELLNMDREKACHQVTSDERKQIRYFLKNLRFTITGHGSFKEAIITAGGIPTREIFPKSMESKLVKGLYFAGEIIDLDGETGGFNLQIAWSTGWLAGNSAVVSQVSR